MFGFGLNFMELTAGYESRTGSISLGGGAGGGTAAVGLLDTSFLRELFDEGRSWWLALPGTAQFVPE